MTNPIDKIATAIFTDNPSLLDVFFVQKHAGLVVARDQVNAHVVSMEKQDMYLTLACSEGVTSVVHKMLDLWATVGMFPPTSTALCMACHGGHVDIIKALIASGCTVTPAVIFAATQRCFTDRAKEVADLITNVSYEHEAERANTAAQAYAEPRASALQPSSSVRASSPAADVVRHTSTVTLQSRL